jgi:cell division protein FtsW (lipid II flippase)
MKDAPGTRDYDWWLIAILLAICTLGVVEIYSATQGSSLAGMHTKQIRWLIVGFVLMFVLSRLDYHLFWSQTVAPPDWGIVSGVGIGKVDYNHLAGALLR